MGCKRSSKSSPAQEMGSSHRSSSARAPVIRLIQFKPTHVVRINAVDFRSTVQGLTGQQAQLSSVKSGIECNNNNNNNGYPDERSGSDRREPLLLMKKSPNNCISETCWASADADINMGNQLRDLAANNSWASDSTSNSSGTCSADSSRRCSSSKSRRSYAEDSLELDDVFEFDGLCTSLMLMEAESATTTTTTTSSSSSCTTGRRLLEELHLSTITTTTTTDRLCDLDEEDDQTFFSFLTNILSADAPTT